MRIYVLVEGRRTEAKVYPAWLSHIIPRLQRIRSYDDNADNSYFLLSAEGYPSIYEDLVNAVQDVNAVGNYDYLMLCLDSDETSVEERQAEVDEVLVENQVRLHNAQLVIIVQNRCIETWFLGNRRVVKRNPLSHVLREYLQHYNVTVDDPELMALHPDFTRHAQFHASYIKEIFLERRLHYSKKFPGPVLEGAFLDELRRRIASEPTHLASLRSLLRFLDDVNARLDTGI
jgi:hypothetical protein